MLERPGVGVSAGAGREPSSAGAQLLQPQVCPARGREAGPPLTACGQVGSRPPFPTLGDPKPWGSPPRSPGQQPTALPRSPRRAVTTPSGWAPPPTQISEPGPAGHKNLILLQAQGGPVWHPNVGTENLPNLGPLYNKQTRDRPTRGTRKMAQDSEDEQRPSGGPETLPCAR